VPRTVFWPVPNVDSGLVAFSRHSSVWTGPGRPGTQAGPGAPPAGEGASRAEVFAVVDAAFAQRRKTLRAALARWAGSAEAAADILRAAGVDPGARGEALTVADFAAIAAARAGRASPH
jgi:16S rRNA (adenine1518-N6/adenine1519-N6)-dimethyltransferase